MKAIETTWKGYRFRSRLEARWAVFLTALGVQWEYEPEGYVLNDGTWYLPDFWLPRERVWIEVKGAWPAAKEIESCARLAEESGRPVVMVMGTPGYEALYGPSGGPLEPTHTELVLLGYNPPPSRDWQVWHWSMYLEERDGPLALEEFLIKEGLVDRGMEFGSERDRIIFLIEKDREYYRNKYGEDHPTWACGLRSTPGLDRLVLRGRELAVGVWPCGVMAAAATAARSARFEHGESPA